MTVISRQAVLDIISDVMPIYSDDYHYILEQRVKDLPSAEKTAKWLSYLGDCKVCSKCGGKFIIHSKYCPDCGCRMKGVEE